MARRFKWQIDRRWRWRAGYGPPRPQRVTNPSPWRDWTGVDLTETRPEAVERRTAQHDAYAAQHNVEEFRKDFELRLRDLRDIPIS